MLWRKSEALGQPGEKPQMMGSAHAAATWGCRGFSNRQKRVLDRHEISARRAGRRGRHHVGGGGGGMRGRCGPRACWLSLDTEFSNEKLEQACLLLRCDPFCLFVATYADAVRNGTDRRLYPGAGAIVRSIQVGSGREPMIVGKPAPFCLQPFGGRLATANSIMVGDRLDTDTAVGQAAGMTSTLLMMTGVTTPEELSSSSIVPTCTCPSFESLYP